MRKVIVNTTPLIALSDIGLLWLLKSIYGEIYIPQAVYDEVLSEPAKTEISNNLAWIHILSVNDVSQKQMYRARLHRGEVEVMILAQEQEADLIIIDDNAAKKTANYLGFNTTGTLGVLLRAKKESLIVSVKQALQELLDNDFFISERVRQYVLEAAKE